MAGGAADLVSGSDPSRFPIRATLALVVGAIRQGAVAAWRRFWGIGCQPRCYTCDRDLTNATDPDNGLPLAYCPCGAPRRLAHQVEEPVPRA